MARDWCESKQTISGLVWWGECWLVVQTRASHVLQCLFMEAPLCHMFVSSGPLEKLPWELLLDWDVCWFQIFNIWWGPVVSCPDSMCMSTRWVIEDLLHVVSCADSCFHQQTYTCSSGAHSVYSCLQMRVAKARHSPIWPRDVTVNITSWQAHLPRSRSLPPHEIP